MGANKAVSETDLWDWLRTPERFFGRDLHISRIENLVGTGDPDVRGTLRGKTFDIELKTADRPAKEDTAILNPRNEYIRASQKVWHRCNWLAGGSCYVLLQVGSRDDARRYLLPGKWIRELEGHNEAFLSSLSILKHERAVAYEVILAAASYR